MISPKFKVGDKVSIIKSRFDHTNPEVGIVIQVLPPYALRPIKVHFADSGSCWFHETELELADKEEREN